MSPLKEEPVDYVKWVPIEQVEANLYNPNSVAHKEMGLLYTSILHDHYTQPIVTIYDKERKKYIIVDGFHRYFVCKSNADIRERNKGLLPVVVLDKDINDRMASTVRHNRARGKHSVEGMSSMVFKMLDNGWEDAAICVTPDTELYTPNGIKEISDIRVGEYVLTHTGKFKKVLNTHHRYIEEDIYKTQCKGLESLNTTHNHPYLVDSYKRLDNRVQIKGDRVGKASYQRIKTPSWVPAKELVGRTKIPSSHKHYSNNEAHRAIIPFLNNRNLQVIKISDIILDLDYELVDNRIRFSGRGCNGNWIHNEVNLSVELGWVLGFYLAEGLTSKNSVVWYAGHTEEEFLRRIQKFIKSLGLNSTLRKVRTGFSLSCYSTILKHFVDSFGRLSYGKYIPEWVMSSCGEFQDALIDGYISGDGHVNSTNTSIVTVSYSLAKQIQLLLWSRKIHSSFYTIRASKYSIDGREGSSREAYNVVWKTNPSEVRVVGFEDSYAAFPLISTDISHYEGDVYNLEVEDDNSYVTTGGTVHNCNELGMEAEELLRLKHITGFSKLFEDFEYCKAWKTKHQLMLEKNFKENKD
ncbi:hypothetical protein BH09PAT1_BH09PAT1_7260 [soil metagenome]